MFSRMLPYCRSFCACALFFTLFTLSFVLLPGSSWALDYDGDGRGELSTFMPLDSSNHEGIWSVYSSGLGGLLVYQWGLNGDVPVPGNYSGGKGADIAVWRPSRGDWYIRRYDEDLKFAEGEAYQWGLPGDKPLVGDFSGDGKADLTVYRISPFNYQAYWFVNLSDHNYESAFVQPWGLLGDRPVPADYDMDGKSDYTVYRPTDGNWYIISSMTSLGQVVPWGGGADDVPVPGKYDNDSVTDIAVYRWVGVSSPLWIIRLSGRGGLVARVVQWGAHGDVPVPADYDGDGRTDIAVYRPTATSAGEDDSVWYILTSESDFTEAQAYQFGRAGDIPVTELRNQLQEELSGGGAV